jgi:hypothetical protein
VPDPSVIPVVPQGKGLLQPLHDRRQLKPIRGFDIKRQPVVGKTQPANREGKPAFRLPEYLVKQRQGVTPAEQGFPVVYPGADFVPHPVFQFT